MRIKYYQMKVREQIFEYAERISLEKLKFLCVLLYIAILRCEVFASTTLLDAADKNASTIFDRFVTTFDKTVFPLVGLFLLLGLAIFGKNEQMCKVLKTGITWLIIAFIALNCFNLLVNTLMWIVGLLNGSSTSTIIPETSANGG